MLTQTCPVQYWLLRFETQNDNGNKLKRFKRWLRKIKFLMLLILSFSSVYNMLCRPVGCCWVSYSLSPLPLLARPSALFDICRWSLPKGPHLALFARIRLGWKSTSGTNNLAKMTPLRGKIAALVRRPTKKYTAGWLTYVSINTDLNFKKNSEGQTIQLSFPLPAATK